MIFSTLLATALLGITVSTSTTPLEKRQDADDWRGGLGRGYYPYMSGFYGGRGFGGYQQENEAPLSRRDSSSRGDAALVKRQDADD